MSKSPDEARAGVQRPADRRRPGRSVAGVAQVVGGERAALDPLDDQRVVVGQVVDDRRCGAALGGPPRVGVLGVAVDREQVAVRARTAGRPPSAPAVVTLKLKLVSPPSSGSTVARPAGQLGQVRPAGRRGGGHACARGRLGLVAARRSRQRNLPAAGLRSRPKAATLRLRDRAADRRPLPASASVVVIGGGVGGASVAYHLAERGQTDVRAGRPVGADQRLDVPLGRPRRAAARRPDADPDEHLLGRALPAARRQTEHAAGLGRVRRHPAGVLAGADGGDPPADQLGDVRSACRWRRSRPPRRRRCSR